MLLRQSYFHVSARRLVKENVAAITHEERSWYTCFQNDNFIDEHSKTKGTVIYQIILRAILKAQTQMKNRMKSF